MEFDPELYFQFYEWESILEVIHYRGRIAFDNSIEYIIHTNEQGHNKPHLHARYRDREVVIDLIDGTILAGKISGNQAKKASSWVQTHKDYVNQKWNELSNGIKIPVR